MKKLLCMYMMACAATFCLPSSTFAELVTIDEARQIADNWVRLIIHATGSWGGHQTAQTVEVEEFRSGERLLGYYCTIDPSGYVVISSVKGLAPVKTYSGSSTLDPQSNEGPAALIKFQMERVVHEIEMQAGPLPGVKTEDVERLQLYKYSPVWKMLNVPTEKFADDLNSGAIKGNYMAGDSLLSSGWHQSDPYNRWCPAPTNECPLPHCLVGCVATAGAQIMRYWSWPPGRIWGVMPDSLDSTSSSVAIDAVAELCSSVGQAVGMKYCDNGCESAVPTADMEGVYEGSYYGDCVVPQRIDYTAEQWWAGPGMVRDQISVNRPIQYRILSHSIVLDGWREWYWGYYQPEYHMNYGWADAHNAWYFIDALHQVVDTGNWSHEYMVIGIVPNVSMETPIAGMYPADPGFPYRYIDRDCYASSTEFQEGQLIQFLPGVVMVCQSGYIRFSGSPAHHSALFTPEPNRGIKIQDGALVVHPGGGIKFQLDRPGP